MSHTQVSVPEEDSTQEKKVAGPPRLVFGRWWPIFFVVRILVGGIIAGGANAGLAVAYYKGEKNIKVWPFPRTLAGDAALTVFLLSLIGWLLDGMLAFRDFQKGLLPPFPKVAALPLPAAFS